MKLSVNLYFMIFLLLAAYPVNAKRDTSSKDAHKKSSFSKIVNDLLKDAPIKIDQKKVNKADGVLSLCKSGKYILVEDIVGTIKIKHDNICLDLCCHTINANNTKSAIIARNQTSITIENGCVVNSQISGIHITGCTDVKVANIAFRNHDAIGLKIAAQLIGDGPRFILTKPSQGILVAECDFSRCSRALVLRGCKNAFINTINAYTNRDTRLSVIGIELSSCIDLKNINACNNIKDVRRQCPEPEYENVCPAMGIVTIQASSNVRLLNCKINNNRTVQDKEATGLAGLVITDTILIGNEAFSVPSRNFKIDCCEFNGNRVLSTPFIEPPFFGAAVYGFLASGISDYEIINSQASSNRVPSGIVAGFANVTSTGGRFTRCTANKNRLRFGSPESGHNTQNAYGFYFAKCKDMHIVNSQAAEQQSVFGGATGIRFRASHDLLLKDSIFNNNGNDTGNPDESTSWGSGVWLSEFSKHILLQNCQATGNQGFVGGHGIRIIADNVLIQDCQANKNSGTGGLFNPSITFPFPAHQGGCAGIATFGGENIVLERCQAASNFCVNQLAAGILFSPLFSPDQADIILPGLFDARIIDCVAGQNISMNNEAFGIACFDYDTTVIKHCQAHNNISQSLESSTLMAGGIALRAITRDAADSLIQNCQAYFNEATQLANLLQLNPLITLVDSTDILVSQPFHGLFTGFAITLSGAQTINGIDAERLNGPHVVTVIDENRFTITLEGAAATATGSGGGNSVRVLRQNPSLSEAAGIHVEGINTFGFQTYSRVSIENCEAKNNQANVSRADGIRLVGNVDRSSIKDCLAASNATAGFADLALVPNFFAGNTAEDNQIDYENTTAPITVYGLDLGTYTPAPPNRWSNIQIVPLAPETNNNGQ